MGKFQDSMNSLEMEVGVREGKKSDHRQFHQANGMGIPASEGWSEGICCGTLQRTLGQGGYY